MEGAVAPPDVDREIYRVALGGAGTEEPYWRGGDLHEYGAWWLIAQLESRHPGFVRRLLALAATRSDADADGLEVLARALGGGRVVEAEFTRFARTALDDPLVGRALRPRPAARLGAGGRIVLHASVPALGLLLWRVPATVAAVSVRRTDGTGLGVVVRRGSSERTLSGSGPLRLASGRGALLILVAGGARSARVIRLVLSG
jgi:hypothetical protein